MFDLSLYFITNSDNICENKFLNIIEEACIGGVTIIQLREKDKSTKDFIELALKVKKITDRYNIPLIIDDRIDVALAVNASGVHLGTNDMDIKTARNILGKDKIIGSTAKNRTRALESQNNGADYLGVGAIYNTTTKVETKITSIDTLKDIVNSVDIPICAIGGLDINNIDILKNTNISGVCTVSAIMKSDNPREYSKDFLNKINTLIKKENYL